MQWTRTSCDTWSVIILLKCFDGAIVRRAHILLGLFVLTFLLISHGRFLWLQRNRASVFDLGQERDLGAIAGGFGILPLLNGLRQVHEDPTEKSIRER